MRKEIAEARIASCVVRLPQTLSRVEWSSPGFVRLIAAGTTAAQDHSRQVFESPNYSALHFAKRQPLICDKVELQLPSDQLLPKGPPPASKARKKIEACAKRVKSGVFVLGWKATPSGPLT